MSSEVEVEVDIDEDAIARLVLDNGVQADLAGRGDRVVAVAQQIAPVDTGHYRDSIRRLPEPDWDGTVWVQAEAHYALFVEWGTRQTDRHGRSIHPPRYTLATALDAAAG